MISAFFSCPSPLERGWGEVIRQLQTLTQYSNIEGIANFTLQRQLRLILYQIQQQKVPFTFSHPAAVLPLAFLPGKWTSVTALVIGSITPDFEYFLRLEQYSIYSHTWRGVFWFDLPLALLLVYLFNSLVKKECIEHLPLFLNRRFSRFESAARNLNSLKDFAIVVISLLIGITSHIIWDKLTHKTVHLIDEQEHYTVFWEANSVVGAAVIAAVVLNMRQGKNTQQNNIVFYWLLVSIITSIFVYIRFLASTELNDLGVSAISGFFIGMTVTSLAAKLKKKRWLRTA